MITKLNNLLAIGVLGAFLGGACHAAQINGSMALSGIGVLQANGTGLGDPNAAFTTVMTLTSSPGAGDYSPVPVLQDFGPQFLDLTSLIGFTLSNASFGTFVASTGVVLQQDTNFLDIFLTGMFTPGPGLDAGLEPTNSSLRISINQSGASISEALTLNSPALEIPGAPEPGTITLMGGALLGLSLVMRRKLTR